MTQIPEEERYRLRAKQNQIIEIAARLKLDQHVPISSNTALANEMVATGNPQHAWQCAVCGYIYGK